MDKNKKKIIGTAVAGVAAGVGGSEAARRTKEWINKPEEDKSENHDTPTNNHATTNTTPTPQPAPVQNQDNYQGITEIQPVDTGGAADVTAEIVVEVPEENIIAEVDYINPDEIAEAIITPIEDIIDGGVDVATIHHNSEENVDEEIIEEPDVDDEDDLAEAEEDEDSNDEGEMIDDIV